MSWNLRNQKNKANFCNKFNRRRKFRKKKERKCIKRDKHNNKNIKISLILYDVLRFGCFASELCLEKSMMTVKTVVHKTYEKKKMQQKTYNVIVVGSHHWNHKTSKWNETNRIKMDETIRFINYFLNNRN